MSILRDLANEAECVQEKRAYAPGASPGIVAIPRPSTLLKSLECKKKSLEEELSLVNAALDTLQANPEFEKMVNLLSQL